MYLSQSTPLLIKRGFRCFNPSLRNLSTKSDPVITRYNEQQRKTIIATVNNRPEKDLIRFSLGKSRAQILKKNVDDFGHFDDLEKIYSLLNIKEHSFKKFCDSILFDDEVGGASKLRLANIISPNSSPQELKKVQSVVGICIAAGNTTFTWAEVTRDFELKDWSNFSPLQCQVKKMTPAIIFDAVCDVCSKLPDAEAFVLESPAALLPQQVYMQSYIQKREMEAMLLTLLNSREPLRHRVHFLRSKLAYRLYGTQIGSECVSLQPLTERLSNGEGIGPNNSTHVKIENPEVKAAFRAQLGAQKEVKSSALLLALTFLKLAVLEDYDCVKALKLL